MLQLSPNENHRNHVTISVQTTWCGPFHTWPMFSLSFSGPCGAGGPPEVTPLGLLWLWLQHGKVTCSISENTKRKAVIVCLFVFQLQQEVTSPLPICHSVVFLGFDFCECWTRKSKPKENTALTGVNCSVCSFVCVCVVVAFLSLCVSSCVSISPCIVQNLISEIKNWWWKPLQFGGGKNPSNIAYKFSYLNDFSMHRYRGISQKQLHYIFEQIIKEEKIKASVLTAN